MLTGTKRKGSFKGQSQYHRRNFLKIGGAASLAAVASPLAAPYVGKAQAASKKTLKVQSLWSRGGIGYQTFETWCNSIVERRNVQIHLTIHHPD